MLTGDATEADPVCDKSPKRHLVDEAIAKSLEPASKPLVFRNPKNSKIIAPANG